MDEPFASVDAQTRADLEDLVLEVRRQYDITIVFVTHDIDESVYLSDRIVVLTPSPTQRAGDAGRPAPTAARPGADQGAARLRAACARTSGGRSSGRTRRGPPWGRRREPGAGPARAGARAQPVPARPAGRASRPSSLADVRPLEKRELVEDQRRHPPFGTNLTFPLERYTHLNQTSGTTGSPLRVLDTTEDWAWWAECLATTYRAAGIGPGDRVALAFSFGPHVQFWDARDGLERVGAMAITLGGMSSVQRLQTLSQVGATALVCTPSYALRLYEVAVEENLEDAFDSVEKVICAGEPGASLPAVRARIEDGLGARAYDHAGLSETGPFAYPCAEGGGLHVERGGVRLRGPRRRPAAGGARCARRARPDPARPPRLAGAALPHRRRGRELDRGLPGRPPAPLAARRDRRADRRHGRHPRHERVPVGDRAGGARRARHGRVPAHVLHRARRDGRGQARGRARARRDGARRSRRRCASSSGCACASCRSASECCPGPRARPGG